MGIRDYYRIIVAINYGIDTGLLTFTEAIKYGKKHDGLAVYNCRTKEITNL